MPETGSEIETITDVLGALDGVIARAIDRGSRLGYFAVLYRKVTARVAEGIAGGVFEDGERMERLDVCFARRYLSAVNGLEDKDGLSRSWELAIRATDSSRPIIL
jgi:hypothetical protein